MCSNKHIKASIHTKISNTMLTDHGSLLLLLQLHCGVPLSDEEEDESVFASDHTSSLNHEGRKFNVVRHHAGLNPTTVHMIERHGSTRLYPIVGNVESESIDDTHDRRKSRQQDNYKR